MNTHYQSNGVSFSMEEFEDRSCQLLQDLTFFLSRHTDRRAEQAGVRVDDRIHLRTEHRGTAVAVRSCNSGVMLSNVSEKNPAEVRAAAPPARLPQTSLHCSQAVREAVSRLRIVMKEKIFNFSLDIVIMCHSVHVLYTNLFFCRNFM